MLLWTVLAGCGRREPGVCEQYVHCAWKVEHERGYAAATFYGEDGSCWELSDAAVCEAACTQGMLELYVISDDPACETAGVGFATYEDFLVAFYDKYCEEYEECTGEPCPVLGDPTTGTWDCNFDPVAASQCLALEWECVEYSFMSALVFPDVCSYGVCSAADSGGRDSYRDSGWSR